MIKSNHYQWEVFRAKNGELTLLLNGISIYSQYSPYKDATSWIKSQLDENADCYLLIGLGLGYHLRALNALVKKKIIVYYFEESEYLMFKRINQDNWWLNSNIELVDHLSNLSDYENLQLLLPAAWLRAIGKQHNLYSILDTIKINQLSYKEFAPLMESNFQKNSKLEDAKPYPAKTSLTACLVSSGPSLNETLHLLKKFQGSVDIYVVGSILKKILNVGIKPKAVIISDPENIIVEQLEDIDYTGDLFYLSTANHETVALHKGNRFILCQQGYRLAEQYAKKVNLPLLDTGGSVATITFSLIEYLNYETIILFGQDLGFTGVETHASQSTSGRIVSQNNCLQLKANDASMINTLPNLQVYWRWFEQKINNTSLKVYNTAYKGAMIKGAPYIDERNLELLLTINQPIN